MNEEREKPSVGPLGDMVRETANTDAAMYAKQITDALESGHKDWAEACDTSPGFLATLLVDAWNKGRESQGRWIPGPPKVHGTYLVWAAHKEFGVIHGTATEIMA